MILIFRGSSVDSDPFRVQYSQLGQLRSFVKAPVIAMTATSDDETTNYVCESLFMTNVYRKFVDINKTNIR